MQAISESGRRPSAALHLLARLVADDALEVTHHRRIRMRAGDRTDAVEGVGDIGDPVAQRLVHRILERVRAGRDRAHFGAEHFHAQHVRLLPLDIDRAHIDDAGQAELGAKRGGGDAMHAGAGLGDDALLAHAQGQHDLAGDVVHLVRAGVVEILALEIDFGAAEFFRQAFGEIQRRRPADEMGEMVVHLLLIRRVGLGRGIGRFQFENIRHQRLGDEAAAIDTEMAALVGAGAE